MKIRNGFVSNSSSSSFLLLVTKDAYDKIFPTLDPLTQAVAEGMITQETVFGIDCMRYKYTSGNYSSLEWLQYDDILNRAVEIGKQLNKPVTPYNDFDPSDSTCVKDFIVEEAYKLREYLNSAELKAQNKVFTNTVEF